MCRRSGIVEHTPQAFFHQRAQRLTDFARMALRAPEQCIVDVERALHPNTA
jgi:hypothetical protein